MLNQVIKVVDLQRDFWPLPDSERGDPVAVVAEFYAAEAKKQKQKEIQKMCPKLVLKITRKTS